MIWCVCKCKRLFTEDVQGPRNVFWIGGAERASNAPVYLRGSGGMFPRKILKFRASKITRNAYIKPGKMSLNFYHHFLCFLHKNVNLSLIKIYAVHLMWQTIQIILRAILKFISCYHLNWISPNRINKISRKRNKPQRFRVGPCRVYHMLVQLAGYMKEADQRQYRNVPKLRLRLSFRLTNS